ncbi:hypothetical protein NQZ68_010645 [Dissostichus eleginoides]|nr:hypothetical protein NQZ68_010645 [Dissostichus eleginoides]
MHSVQIESGAEMRGAVQSLNSLNDQIAQFMVTRPCSLAHEDESFMPGERDTLRKSMTLMRHLLMDAQTKEKFAGSSELSEALRHVSMTEFSACWPCLCQTVHPPPLHVLQVFSFKGVQDGGFCRMGACCSDNRTDSCYSNMFVA